MVEWYQEYLPVCNIKSLFLLVGKSIASLKSIQPSTGSFDVGVTIALIAPVCEFGQHFHETLLPQACTNALPAEAMFVV